MRQSIPLSKSALSLVLVGMAAVVLLSSCLGVDMHTRFNADGSGIIKMRLQISRALLQMSQEEGASPIPLTKQDLEAAYKDLPGVKVESVTEENTDKDKIITATIDFKDFSVFKSTKDLAGTGATLTKGPDGRTTYSVIIGAPQELEEAPGVSSQPLPGEGTTNGALQPEAAQAAPGAEQAGGASSGGAEGQSSATQSGAAASDESEQAVDSMFKSMLAGYSLEYSVTAPRKIVSHTLGELSGDGRTVVYTIKMADYVDLKAPLAFQVVW